MDYLNKNCLTRLPNDFRNIGLSSKEDKFENIGYYHHNLLIFKYSKLGVLYPNFSKFVFVKIKKTIGKVHLSGKY